MHETTEGIREPRSNNSNHHNSSRHIALQFIKHHAKVCSEAQTKRTPFGGWWWHTPLIPALVVDRGGWGGRQISELEDSLVYIQESRIARALLHRETLETNKQTSFLT